MKDLSMYRLAQTNMLTFDRPNRNRLTVLKILNAEEMFVTVMDTHITLHTLQINSHFSKSFWSITFRPLPYCLNNFNLLWQVCVNGPKTADVYKFLKASKRSSIFGSGIKWNFTKFLIGKDGKVIKRYGTTTSPLSIEVLIKSLPLPSYFYPIIS